MIPTAAFWDGEAEILFRILFPLIEKAALSGVREASSSVGIVWDVANEEAKRWAEKYSFALVKGITSTSEAMLQEKVSAWLGSSRRELSELIESLAPVFGDYRAEMIAITEVTRALYEGNIAAWRTSPYVTGKKWMTSEDELVCDICGPLGNSSTVPLDGEFESGYNGPPAHVNCRCWIQPVVEVP